MPSEPDIPASRMSARSAATADLASFCATPRPPWPAGWTVHYHEETSSTQDLARAAALAGAPHGGVWVADWQRAGRGRRGRVWTAPPGTSLLLSVVVRGCRLAPFAQMAASSLALCETLEALGLTPQVKWPNDVLLRDRKVSGLLAEQVAGAGEPFTIVGLGLNVRYGAAAHALPPTATALDWELAALAPAAAALDGESAAASHPAPPLPTAASRPDLLARGPLLAALLRRLAVELARPTSAWETELYGRWLARLWRHRQTVRLADGAAVLEGRAEGVATDGALLLRLTDGSLRRITTGDVLLDS